MTMNLVSVDFKGLQGKRNLHSGIAELSQPDKLKQTFLKVKGYFDKTILRSEYCLNKQKECSVPNECTDN